MQKRSNARAFIVSPAKRVLLMKVHDDRVVDPSRLRPPDFWTTIGGGVQAGETFEEAMLREVAEEANLTRVSLGPVLWEREVTLLKDGSPRRKNERYFVVWSTSEDVEHAGQSESEKRDFRGFRWWTEGELRASSESFAPDEIPTLARQAIAMPRSQDPT